MTLEEINSKKEELRNQLGDEGLTEEKLEEIKAEVEQIINEVPDEEPVEEVKEEPVEEISEDEERKLMRDTEVLEKRNVNIVNVVNKKEEKNMEKELRNSKEYIDAYAEYIKTGEEKELRALLTSNATVTGDGITKIEVPDFIDGVIRTAWEKEGLMALVRRISVKGNFKVEFEVSGDPAVVHAEGGDAVDEEDLVLGIVEIKPASIKKWISISDEALDMRGEEFLRYIYDELTYRIAKKTADILVGKITALPQSLTPNQAGDYDSVSADKITEDVNVATIDLAAAHLNEQASDITVVMNRLTRAEFVKAAKEANYPMDLFAGVRVVYNNTLPAYSTATAGQTYLIVGDFNIGAMANYPSGQDIELKFDDKTLMTKDLVRILGRRYVGVEAVADKAFTLVAKPGASV